MRTKLTALTVLAAALAAAGIAHAAPIPVASYNFTTLADVQAFQKVAGGSCKRKWSGNQALAITVGDNTNSCVYRTSVVADSSDKLADQGITATTAATASNSSKQQKKAFVGVGVRQSDSAGYLLRVLPGAHKWQLLRDPKGAAGPGLMASGSGKFVKFGARKSNSLALRAFSYGGTSTSVLASVNGRTVVSTTDSGPDQPDGRRTVVAAGAKGSAAGTGIFGIYDSVVVQVPNPF